MRWEVCYPQYWINTNYELVNKYFPKRLHVRSEFYDYPQSIGPRNAKHFIPPLVEKDQFFVANKAFQNLHEG